MNTETAAIFGDIYCAACEYGMDIIFNLRTESTVHRDRYRSIDRMETTTPTTIKALPVTFQPNRKQLEKAGLTEEVEVLVYTASKFWDDLSIDFDDISMIVATVDLLGKEYSIKEKGLSGQIGNSWGYYTFGLVKR